MGKELFFFKPSALLRTLHMLLHLILTATHSARYNCLQFTDEDLGLNEFK